jgi:hypothetical protein
MDHVYGRRWLYLGWLLEHLTMRFDSTRGGAPTGVHLAGERSERFVEEPR